MKEEEPENLTENDENFSQNFMSSDICDIELKEEDEQEFQGNNYTTMNSDQNSETEL